jgi:hypothetical protein
MKFFTWLYNQFYPPKYKVQLHVGVVGARENLPQDYLELEEDSLRQPADQDFVLALWLDITDQHGNKIDFKNKKSQAFRRAFNNFLLKTNNNFSARGIQGFPLNIDFITGVTLWRGQSSILINANSNIPINTIIGYIKSCYEQAVFTLPMEGINFNADVNANIRFYNQQNHQWTRIITSWDETATLASLMPVTTLDDYLVASGTKHIDVLNAKKNSESSFASIKTGDYECGFSLEKLNNESKLIVVLYNAGDDKVPNFRFNFYEADSENKNVKHLIEHRSDPKSKCPILALQEFKNIAEFLKFLDKFKEQQPDPNADIPMPRITNG